MVLMSILLLGCQKEQKQSGQNNPDSILIFAASSLTNVLKDLVSAYQSENHVEINIHTASSGTLARQIMSGAEPNLLISANKKWVEYLLENGKGVRSSVVTIAENKLVIIAPRLKANRESNHSFQSIDSSFSFGSLPGVSLAIGNPAHVPAGIYTKQALHFMKWWEALESHILKGKDVRAALLMVELGEMPYGIVYKSDALKSNKVLALGEFPQESHEPIHYVTSVISQSKEAEAFLTFLQSEEMKKLWYNHGFK